MNVKGGASLGSSQGMNVIGGHVTGDVPLHFAMPPNAPPASPRTPVIEFAATPPPVVLDATTASAADSALGTGGADRLAAGLNEALTALLGAIGTRSLPVMGFTVLPGVDSHERWQLSALPTVAWIDRETLGVFGYYRAAASGGDVTAKHAGDLSQPHEEFFSQPGPVSIVPGRRFALLLAADAFKMVIGCPAVRD